MKKVTVSNKSQTTQAGRSKAPWEGAPATGFDEQLRNQIAMSALMGLISKAPLKVADKDSKEVKAVEYQRRMLCKAALDYANTMMGMMA